MKWLILVTVLAACGGCLTYETVDAETGIPLEGVKVTRHWGSLVTGRGNTGTSEVGVTGKDGRISPPHRPVAMNSVEFVKEGYHSASALHDAHSSTNRVSVSDGVSHEAKSERMHGIIRIPMHKKSPTSRASDSN